MTLLVSIGITVSLTHVYAGVPDTARFQQIFLNANAAALSGSKTITFKLYTGGSAIWTETIENYAIEDGQVDIRLGLSTPLTPSLLNQTSLTLGITIQGEEEVQMTVYPMPYGILAKSALDTDTIGGTAASDIMLQALSNLTILGVTKGGTGSTTTFTSGSVIFAGTSGVYTQNADKLVWDTGNNRLAINQATASYPVDINGDVRFNSITFGLNTKDSAAHDTSTLSSGFTHNSDIHIASNLDSIDTNINHHILLKTKGTTRISIQSTGSIGIGTESPTDELTVVGNTKTNAQAISTTTSAAPLAVSSTTQVSNLNADLLDGNDSTAFAAASHTHSASDITSGTLAIARGGTGLGAPPSDGQLLIGNGSSYTLGTLSSASFSIANSTGAITISPGGMAGDGLTASSGVMVNAGSGLSVSGGQLAVSNVPGSVFPDGSILNSQLSNNNFTIQSDSGNANLALGDTLRFVAGDNISLSLSGQTVTIDRNNAPSLIWTQTGNTLFYTAGNVGIGTASPADTLQINGDLRINGIALGTGANIGFSSFAMQGITAWNNQETWVAFKYDGRVSPPIQFWLVYPGGDFKSFIIPHPVAPDKYLVHNAIEGPEAAVFYRGESQLKNGTCTITLPSYFEKLTHTDARTVQLTALNGAAPLYVDGDVQNGEFTVKTTRGGNPNQAFMWEVKATRKDIAKLETEPQKTHVKIKGQAPYQYLE